MSEIYLEYNTAGTFSVEFNLRPLFQSSSNDLLDALCNARMTGK